MFLEKTNHSFLDQNTKCINERMDERMDVKYWLLTKSPPTASALQVFILSLCCICSLRCYILRSNYVYNEYITAILNSFTTYSIHSKFYVYTNEVLPEKYVMIYNMLKVHIKVFH